MKKLLNVGILLLCFSPLVTVAQYAGFIDLRSSAGTNCEFIALNTNETISIKSVVGVKPDPEDGTKTLYSPIDSRDFQISWELVSATRQDRENLEPCFKEDYVNMFNGQAKKIQTQLYRDYVSKNNQKNLVLQRLLEENEIDILRKQLQKMDDWHGFDNLYEKIADNHPEIHPVNFDNPEWLNNFIKMVVETLSKRDTYLSTSMPVLSKASQRVSDHLDRIDEERSWYSEQVDGLKLFWKWYENQKGSKQLDFSTMSQDEEKAKGIVEEAYVNEGINKAEYEVYLTEKFKLTKVTGRENISSDATYDYTPLGLGLQIDYYSLSSVEQADYRAINKWLYQSYSEKLEIDFQAATPDGIAPAITRLSMRYEDEKSFIDKLELGYRSWHENGAYVPPDFENTQNWLTWYYVYYQTEDLQTQPDDNSYPYSYEDISSFPKDFSSINENDFERYNFLLGIKLFSLKQSFQETLKKKLNSQGKRYIVISPDLFQPDFKYTVMILARPKNGGLEYIGYKTFRSVDNLSLNLFMSIDKPTEMYLVNPKVVTSGGTSQISLHLGTLQLGQQQVDSIKIYLYDPKSPNDEITYSLKDHKIIQGANRILKQSMVNQVARRFLQETNLQGRYNPFSNEYILTDGTIITSNGGIIFPDGSTVDANGIVTLSGEKFYNEGWWKIESVNAEYYWVNAEGNVWYKSEFLIFKPTGINVQINRWLNRFETVGGHVFWIQGSIHFKEDSWLDPDGTTTIEGDDGNGGEFTLSDGTIVDLTNQLILLPSEVTDGINEVRLTPTVVWSDGLRDNLFSFWENSPENQPNQSSATKKVFANGCEMNQSEDGSWTVNFADGTIIDSQGSLINQSGEYDGEQYSLEDGTIVDLEQFIIFFADGTIVFFSPIKINLSDGIALLFSPAEPEKEAIGVTGLLNPFSRTFKLTDGTVYYKNGEITRPNGLKLQSDGQVLEIGSYKTIWADGGIRYVEDYALYRYPQNNTVEVLFYYGYLPLEHRVFGIDTDNSGEFFNIYLPSNVQIGTTLFYVNGRVKFSDGTIVYRNGETLLANGAKVNKVLHKYYLTDGTKLDPLNQVYELQSPDNPGQFKIVRLKASVVITSSLSSYNLFDEWTYQSQDQTFTISSTGDEVVFSNGCSISKSRQITFQDGTIINEEGDIIVDSVIQEDSYLILVDGTIIDLKEFTITFPPQVKVYLNPMVVNTQNGVSRNLFYNTPFSSSTDNSQDYFKDLDVDTLQVIQVVQEYEEENSNIPQEQKDDQVVQDDSQGNSDVPQEQPDDQVVQDDTQGNSDVPQEQPDDQVVSDDSQGNSDVPQEQPDNVDSQDDNQVDQNDAKDQQPDQQDDGKENSEIVIPQPEQESDSSQNTPSNNHVPDLATTSIFEVKAFETETDIPAIIRIVVKTQTKTYEGYMLLYIIGSYLQKDINCETIDMEGNSDYCDNAAAAGVNYYKEQAQQLNMLADSGGNPEMARPTISDKVTELILDDLETQVTENMATGVALKLNQQLILMARNTNVSNKDLKRISKMVAKQIPGANTQEIVQSLADVLASQINSILGAINQLLHEEYESIQENIEDLGLQSARNLINSTGQRAEIKTKVMAIIAQKVTVGEKMIIEASAKLNIDGEEMSSPSVSVVGDAIPEGAEVLSDYFILKVVVMTQMIPQMYAGTSDDSVSIILDIILVNFDAKEVAILAPVIITIPVMVNKSRDETMICGYYNRNDVFKTDGVRLISVQDNSVSCEVNHFTPFGANKIPKMANNPNQISSSKDILKLKSLDQNVGSNLNSQEGDSTSFAQITYISLMLLVALFQVNY